MLELYPLERENEGDDWVRLELNEEFVATTHTGAIETAISTIRSRVDSLGVAEPSIRQQGQSDIVIELPGLGEDRFEEAKGLIGTTAQLEFHGVHDGNRAYWSSTLSYLPDSGCLEYDPNTQTIWGRVDPLRTVLKTGAHWVNSAPFGGPSHLEEGAPGALPEGALIGFLERITYHPSTGQATP